MKTPDPFKEQSEMQLSIVDFMLSYNKNLPEQFPHVSKLYLKEFQKTYPALFKEDKMWSLEQHRKKVMDWLPRHISSQTPKTS